MSGRAGRTEPCGKVEARTRLAHANAFAYAAELVVDEDDEACLNVSTSLAVLAGIAASDAACCAVLGKRARGQDHREAVKLLSGVATVGTELAKDLARLLDVKDNANDGVLYVNDQKTRQAVKWAQRMIAAAEKVVFV